MTFTITFPGSAKERTTYSGTSSLNALRSATFLFEQNPKVRSIEVYDDSTGKREWVLTRRAGKIGPAIWNGVTEDVTEPSS